MDVLYFAPTVSNVLFVFFNSQDNPKQINNLGEGQAVTVQSECENFNRSFSIPVLKSGLS